MNYLRRLYRWLYTETSDWEEGYWGRLPYLLILRCSVALGIWLRFKLHPEQPLPAWAPFVLAIAIATAFWVHLRKRKSHKKTIYGALLALDIILISAAYWHTHRADSDFYLFYYLPIFTAAEYLGARWVVSTFIASSVAFALVLFFMPRGPAFTQLSAGQLFARVFLGREVFYVMITLVWALRLRRERDSRNSSITRQRQMEQVLSCKRRVDQSFSIDDVLKIVVEQVAGDVTAQSVVGLIESQRGQDAKTIIKSFPDASGPTAEGLKLCEDALKGVDLEEAAPIVVLGGWIGAIAVTGLDARARFTSKEYLRSIAELIAGAYGRARLFDALREIGGAATKAVELNQKLESMLDYLVDDLGFEYAIISLVDTYKDRIETVRARNVPPAWSGLSVFDLDGTDILADIVRTAKTEFFDSYDSRFNFAIWKRFNHQRLARVFSPIIADCEAGPRVIGVIEAGCTKERRANVYEKRELIKILGETSGHLIAVCLPHVLLELIAARAVDLIGADSASLHVFKGNREFLVAGTGSADKEFLRNFSPRPGGIGQRAMSLRQRIVENDIRASNPDLYNKGVHAMAAFPLLLAGDVRGVLYIHYWRTHTFSEAELEFVSVFVPEMEVAIQNSLLLQDISKIDEKAWMVTGLQNVMASLGSNLDAELLLQRLAADALYMLDAKNVSLYEYYQESREFRSKAVVAGRFEAPEEMETQVRPDDIVNTVVAKGYSRFIPDTSIESFLNEVRRDNIARPRFVIREGIKSCAILVLKSPYDSEIVGCIFANYDQFVNFNLPENKGKVNVAYSLASAAALAIKTSRLHALDIDLNHKDIVRRELELAALREVDRAIVASADVLDMRALGETILDQAIHVLGPGGDVTLGDVTLWNEQLKRLDPVAVRGYAIERVRDSLACGSGIVNRVFRERKSALIPDVSEAPDYSKIAEAGSELAVPILDVESGETRVLGVINVEHKHVNAFGERDRAFLETLAVQIAIAIHTVELSGTLHRSLKEALGFGMVGKRILKGDSSLKKLISYILTGLTAKDGLGFSRAFLLNFEEQSSELRGFAGIGSLSQQGAESVWHDVDSLGLEALLDSVDLSAPSLEGAGLTTFLKDLSIPIAEIQEPLLGCLHAPGVAVFTFEASELRDSPLSGLYTDAEHCVVHCVPLRSSEKTIGVLFVDNRFLYHERSIQSRAEPLLIAFAELAVLCIDGAKLRAQLADENQLASWREATDRVSHVLKARILNLKSLPLDVAAALRAFEIRKAQAILVELEQHVAELMEQFERIQKFTSDKTTVLTKVDIVAIAQYAVNTLRRLRGYPITLSTPKNPVNINGDILHLQDMFTELVNNAIRAFDQAAADGNPIVDPTIHISVLELSPDDSTSIVIEDNGPGIQPDVIKKVYDPYLTTTGSTGLGLYMVKKLVEQHNGTIDFETSEHGTKFTIRIPTFSKANAATP